MSSRLKATISAGFPLLIRKTNPDRLLRGRPDSIFVNPRSTPIFSVPRLSVRLLLDFGFRQGSAKRMLDEQSLGIGNDAVELHNHGLREDLRAFLVFGAE